MNKKKSVLKKENTGGLNKNASHWEFLIFSRVLYPFPLELVWNGKGCFQLETQLCNPLWLCVNKSLAFV